MKLIYLISIGLKFQRRIFKIFKVKTTLKKISVNGPNNSFQIDDEPSSFDRSFETKKTSKNNFRSAKITLKIDGMKSKIMLYRTKERDLKLSFDTDPPLLNHRNR